jgi:hypothetical protein
MRELELDGLVLRPRGRRQDDKRSGKQDGKPGRRREPVHFR